MSRSDDPPLRSAAPVDTSEFFFPGEGLSALLIHGLTGTPYEMRYLGERLAAAGIRVRGVRLAGHARAPQDLGATRHDNWYESVVHGFEELRSHGDPNIVVGLSMGAVLASRLAIDQRESVSALVLLAPAFFLPRTATLGLGALSKLGAFANHLYLENSEGSDIHDSAARSVHPTARLMPLSAPISLLAMSRMLRPQMHRITQPLLLMHARNDHTCPVLRNVSFVMKHVRSAQKRAVILENSFHVITVDSEKEQVAQEVGDFAAHFRAPAARRAVGG